MLSNQGTASLASVRRQQPDVDKKMIAKDRGGRRWKTQAKEEDRTVEREKRYRMKRYCCLGEVESEGDHKSECTSKSGNKINSNSRSRSQTEGKEEGREWWEAESKDGEVVAPEW